jgi:hypothetical protein
VGSVVRRIHDLYFSVARGDRAEYRTWVTEV